MAIMTNKIKCLENYRHQASSTGVKCCNVCVLLCIIIISCAFNYNISFTPEECNLTDKGLQKSQLGHTWYRFSIKPNTETMWCCFLGFEIYPELCIPFRLYIIGHIMTTDWHNDLQVPCTCLAGIDYKHNNTQTLTNQHYHFSILLKLNNIRRTEVN